MIFLRNSWVFNFACLYKSVHYNFVLVSFTALAPASHSLNLDGQVCFCLFI